MGVVFLAEHQLMGKQVALKAVKMSPHADPSTLARFRREVKANAILSHPNIVQAYDAEQVDGVCFLVLEYVEGQNLAEVIKDGGPLPVRVACRLAHDAALALQHASNKGIVHRDVKPHNMLLAADGTLKLADFGLTRALSEARPASAVTQVNAVLGTPDYVAPEQAFSPQNADVRADVYSLGCTLYHLLAGQPPFPGDTVQEKLQGHLVGVPAPLHEARPEVPAALEAVVAKMMAKDPSQRYQTPREAALALQPFFAPPAPPRKRRRTLLAAAALLMAALLGGTAAVYTIKTDNGVLVVETDDPDVTVTIKAGGKEVAILDGKTKKQLTLRGGKYSAEVKGAPGLTVEPSDFVLKRGDTVIAKVTRKPETAPVVKAKQERPPVVEANTGAGGLPKELKEWFKEMPVGGEEKARQVNPAVAVDKKGRFVVVWSQEDQDGWPVYARLFDAPNKPAGPPFRVNKTPRKASFGQQVAMAPDGAFVVVWGGRGENGNGIYARRFTAKGEPEGEEFLVNTKPAVTEVLSTSISMSAKGDWIVAYNLGREAGRWNAYVQRFDAKGKKIGTEVRANTRHEAQDGESRVALAPDGRFAVAIGTGADIRVYRFKADGARDGEELIPHGPGQVERGLGHLRFDAKGNLTVVWHARAPRTIPDIYFRRYDAKWAPLDKLERQLTNDGMQMYPTLARGAGGQFLAVWHSGWKGSRRVVANFVSAAGSPRGSPFKVSSATRGTDEGVCVAINDIGACVVVWHEEQEDERRIYARGLQVTSNK